MMIVKNSIYRRSSAEKKRKLQVTNYEEKRRTTSARELAVEEIEEITSGTLALHSFAVRHPSIPR